MDMNPQPGRYVIDPKQSAVRVRVSSFFGLVPVSGHFSVGQGVVDVPERAEDTLVEVSVLASSFDTGHAKRDHHVRSADYLDAERHATIDFRSTGVRRKGAGAVLTGELTVRGRGVPVEVTVDRVGEKDRRLEGHATARVDRYAFGITTAKGMTGRWARLELEIVAHR